LDFPTDGGACSFWHQIQNPNGELLVGGVPMPLKMICSELLGIWCVGGTN
jgi:hypothetical protein